MEADYRISEDDYVEAMKLFSKLTPKLALAYVLVAGVLVLSAVFGPPVLRAGAIGGLVGGGVVFVVGRLFLNPLLARQHYRKYKAIQEPIHLRLREDGVEFSTADGGGVVKWGKVFRWRQDDDYVLIYPMPRIYHIVPKSIRDAGFDVTRLIDSLRAYVGKES